VKDEDRTPTQDWLSYLEEKDDDGFIQRVEGIVGRRLRAMPKGRPRKVG